MKNISLLLLFASTFHFQSFCQKDNESIKTSIAHFFDGISEINRDKLNEYSTADFILLEDGRVWNMDTLFNKINMRKNSGIKRVNKFDYIKIDQNRQSAWISYYNTAEFSLNEKHQTVNWLESAVLCKENGRWKIKMLHSTKITPAKSN